MLGELNTTLLTYNGLIEQARANNRQGLPIGSQYLKDANATLQDDSLPLLKALVKANQDRVDTEFDGIGGGNLWLVVGGLLATRRAGPDAGLAGQAHPPLPERSGRRRRAYWCC